MDLLLIASFAILGSLAGIATGLVPGLHANNVALILASSSPIIISHLSGVDDPLLLVCVAMISCSITHTFVNFIPATFLGAPEGETALTLLPAHSMLLEGRGYQAVALSAIGSMGAIFFGLLLMVPYRYVMGPPINLYGFLDEYMVLILIAISMLLILTERGKVPYKKALVPKEGGLGPTAVLGDGEYGELKLGEECMRVGKVVKIHDPRTFEIEVEWGKRVLVVDETRMNPMVFLNVEVIVEGTVKLVRFKWSRALGFGTAILIFLLSGTFGMITSKIPYGSPLKMPATGLFPALTGLFGVGALLHSLMLSPEIPDQRIDEPVIDRKEMTKSVLIGSSTASILGFLPGMSSAQATILSMLARRNKDPEQVITTLCSVNTADAFFCIIALFTIGRARSGVTAGVMDTAPLEEWSSHFPSQLSAFLIGAIIASVVGYYATRWMGKRFAMIFTSLPYRPLLVVVLGLISALVFLFNGAYGLLTLAVGTTIGLIAPLLGVRRSHAMGVILLPVIVGLL
jgi:TctA family transporter